MTGHTMTWGELKSLVDSAGIKDSDGIFFIDVSFPYVDDDGKPSVVVAPSDDGLGFVAY